MCEVGRDASCEAWKSRISWLPAEMDGGAGFGYCCWFSGDDMAMKGAESLGVPGWMFSVCFGGLPAGGVVVRWC